MRTNSYILNSKRGRRIWLAIALVIGAQIILSAGIRMMVYRYTTADRYMDNKESRFIHLDKRAAKNLDYILVGSSFTKNHLSTEIFSDNGLQVFNFGIPGRLLGDLPSMVAKALSKNPKGIVICLDVADLYHPISTEFPNLVDIKAYLSSDQPMGTIFSTAWFFLLNLNSAHYYREALYNNLVGVLAKFDIRPLGTPPNLPSQKPLAQGQISIDQKQLSEPPDCQVFKSTDYNGAVMRLVNCTNGDGIEYGNAQGNWDKSAWETISLKEVNPHSRQLLVNVLEEISRTGVKPILIFKPIWGHKIIYDAQALQKEIPARVIDFTQVSYPRELWGDDDHFNYYGRKKFSLDVVQALKE